MYKSKGISSIMLHHKLTASPCTDIDMQQRHGCSNVDMEKNCKDQLAW